MTKKKSGSDYSMQSVQRAIKKYQNKGKRLDIYSIEEDVYNKFIKIRDQKGIKNADLLKILLENS